MAGGIRSLFIPGPAGRLEALLNEGSPAAAYAALVCHPHPVYGGTMHNKVVFAAMKALNTLGMPTLRFNFRGAGKSEGTHDHGYGEAGDVRAALDWLDRELHLPMVLAGFSFGAATGMPVGCADGRVRALISLGTPVAVEDRAYSYAFLAECLKPKLFISGTRDQFGPQAGVKRIFALAAEPKELVWVQGADHFFAGKLDMVRSAIGQWGRSELKLSG